MESSLIELSKYRLRENADYKDFEIVSSDMINHIWTRSGNVSNRRIPIW